MKLEFDETRKKWHNKFEGCFFKELEFLKLELHNKLKFYKLKFQKSDRLLKFLPNSGIWPFWPKFLALLIFQPRLKKIFTFLSKFLSKMLHISLFLCFNKVECFLEIKNGELNVAIN